MKKLLLNLLAGAVSLAASAQTASISLTTAPCDSNGVLTATFTGLTPPLSVTWYYPTFVVTHTGVMTMSDVLNGYTGAPVSLYVSGATTGAASTSFGGAEPFTYTFTVTPVICPATTGSMSVAVTGGTPPYSYNWYDVPTLATVGTSNPLVGIAAGTQDGVMITDAAGCRYGSRWKGDSTMMYTAPAFTLATASTVANCTNGTASITGITGGTAPFSYLWSNGATTASITGLTTGSYHVTVTDASGCSEMAYVYVAQSVTITPHFTTTPATCLASDGALMVFATGGTAPYTYLWSNGVTTASQTGVPGGSYDIAVTDANGCSGTGYTSVGVSTPITATYTSTSSLCTSNTGTATLTVGGGTAPYTITWYTWPVQTGLSATVLGPGSHGFHIVDNVGCIRTGAVNINPIDIISLSVYTSPSTCPLLNGTASVGASGGVAPYTYAWNTGGTSAGISSLEAGAYYVTVTDVNGCSKHAGAIVSATTTVSSGLSGTPASCIFNSDGSMHVSAWGGTPPYTYGWTTGATTTTITGLSAGYYGATVTDAVGCSSAQSSYLGYNPSGTSCYCTIKGTVFNDVNNNCVQDAGEAGIPNIQIHCSGRGYTYTDASGHYSFLVPSGTYTVTETVQMYYPLSTCQLNDIVVTAAAATGCILPVNFGNNTLTIHDTRISTWDFNHAIPGNTYLQKCIVTNAGTVSESAILAGYTTDGQLFAPSFAPGGIFSGAPYWYNTAAGFTTLAPGASQAFMLNYGVPTSIPLSTNVVFKDSVAYMAPMSNWLTDNTPWDNVNYFSTTTVASYDPNFKEVTPKGTGPTGIISYTDSVLEYMVHFQNTGTANAENIVVIDTLDPNLNWTTMRPIYQSAPCKVTLNESGVATFTFNDINLPPSSSEPITSCGVFTYKVNIKSGLPVGTTFQNRASIYFDYNAPVLTNTTLNTLGTSSNVSVANVNPAAKGTFAVYPNPASASFNALINAPIASSADLSVCDVTGKALITRKVDVQKGSQTVAVDVNQLTPGVYFVTLNTNGSIQTEKLVIMK